MEKRTILIQIDSDPHPSVFDRVVAVDAGAEEIFSYGNVRPEDVQGLVHGAIFTRGPKDLHRTALFVGGSKVDVGEKLVEEIRKNLIPQFGLQVSVLMDANGCNTTASAAVRVATKHVNLAESSALVLGATGPVGQRVVRLLVREGAPVRVGSRNKERAAQVCETLQQSIPTANLTPVATGSPEELKAALEGQVVVIAAGALGVQLLPKDIRQNCSTLRVAIDLNAVPPLGIEGVEVTDKARDDNGVICYGAVGVGGTKMKIHKAAVARLFERNDQIMDAEEVYALSEGL